MDVDDEVRSYLDRHQPLLVGQLSEWIRIPSVAGVPERKHNLTRSANWLAGELRDLGFPTTEIWQGADGPAVYAEWMAAPGSPTVLIYSHHDVRAVKEENWDQTGDLLRHPAVARRPSARLHQHPRHARRALRGLRSAD